MEACRQRLALVLHPASPHGVRTGTRLWTIKKKKKKRKYRKSYIKPPGGLIFFKHFWGGILTGGLFNLAKRITCSKNTVVITQSRLTRCTIKVTVKSIYFTSLKVTKTNSYSSKKCFRTSNFYENGYLYNLQTYKMVTIGHFRVRYDRWIKEVKTHFLQP